MILTKEKILKMISSKTLYDAWYRNHFKPSSWRVRCLKFGALLIACTLYQPPVVALAVYVLAAGFLALYYFPINEGWFVLFELPDMGSSITDYLNALTLHLISQHPASQTIERGALKAMRDFERVRSLKTALKGGPFAINSVQETESEDQRIDRMMETLKQHAPLITSMAEDLRWLKKLQTSLEGYAKQYVSALHMLPAIPKEATHQLTLHGNHYADLIVQATTHPYEPFDLAA